MGSSWYHGLPLWLCGKESACNAGDAGVTGSITRLARSPRGGHGNPLPDSFLENLMNRGAWLATVHGVATSQTRLKQLSMHAHLIATYWSSVPKDLIVSRPSQIFFQMTCRAPPDTSNTFLQPADQTKNIFSIVPDEILFFFQNKSHTLLFINIITT